MSGECVRVEIHVSGRVQHVGFRNFAKNTASRLGLRGYVKNLSDGRVFVLAEGGLDAVRLFVEYLKEGPRFAGVTHVDTAFKRPTGEFEDFSRV